MPTYQITTDKGTYQVETEANQQSQAQSQPIQQPDTASQDVSNALNDMSGSQAETSLQPMSPGDKAISILGQFGKGVYSNPIAHPALKLLGDWAGANPDQAYAGVGEPQTIGEKVASGLGSAAPLLAIAGPMGMGIDAAISSTKAIPVIGRMTSMLGDSQLAKSALTGLSYGASEAAASNAQGDQVDVKQHALNTAGQFLFWSALAKGGATLGAKFLPKDVLKQPDLLKNSPIIGNATKNFFTPEGLGSIAGGALAGAINAPDQRSGIAGAIIGASLSSMSPSEQFQFRQGMGKAMGFNGISAITDHFGKPFAEANDIFEKFGYDSVDKAGNQQVQKPNDVGGTDTLSTPQIVYEAHQQALNEIKTQKSALFDKALQANENIKPQGINSFLSLLRQRVAGIQDPTSPVVRIFNKTYDALQGFQAQMSESEISGTKDQPNTPLNPRRMNLQELPPKIREQILKENQDTQSQFSLNALHQLKMAMQEMVSPQVWSGDRAMTPEERDANGIATQIKRYIGSQNEAYSEASREWEKFKNVQGKVYNLDPTKLSQNMLTFDETKRNIRENDLNQISKYINDNGQEKYDSRGLLKKYYAYQIYNNPVSAGFAKSYPVREITTALFGGALHLTGMPGGLLLGGLAGWNMSNPQAWLPILKGASIGKNLRILRSIIPNVRTSKKP